jgi:hypothetical protein
MSKAPVLRRRVQGTVRYTWRCCPYATNDSSNRIPEAERANHPVTEGRMKLSIRAGHDAVGWVCEDPNCPYYLGTAITPIQIPYSRIEVNRETGEYKVHHEYIEQVMCPGTFFWEK